MSTAVTLSERGPGCSSGGTVWPIGRRAAGLVAVAPILGLAAPVRAQPQDRPVLPGGAGREGVPEGSVALPGIGGWVMLADDVTLIIALPEDGQLAYVDALEAAEMKRVEVPFKPDPLAVRGKALFASVSGGSSIHVLDLGTGTDRREFRLPTGPVTGLACSREQGPLFAPISDPAMIPDVMDVAPISDAIAYAGRALPNRIDPAKVRGLDLAIDPGHFESFFRLVLMAATESGRCSSSTASLSSRWPDSHSGPPRRTDPPLLTFRGRGTKLAYYDASRGHRLRFFPLLLAERDREALGRASGAGRE